MNWVKQARELKVVYRWETKRMSESDKDTQLCGKPRLSSITCHPPVHMKAGAQGMPGWARLKYLPESVGAEGEPQHHQK